MSNLIKFGRKVPLPSTIEIKHDLRLMAAADELVDAGLWSDAVGLVPTDESLQIVAGDLARKHGISVERAGMLVSRFGSNRHTLEGAAQALRNRMD